MPPKLIEQKVSAFYTWFAVILIRKGLDNHVPNSGYYLDLKEFSLEKLKDRINNTRLLPSQQILQENIDERFACLEQNGIVNLQQLQNSLKTKSDVQSFAKVTGLPVDYLTILRREVNSYQPKPINLRDFSGVNPEVVHKLEKTGIKNTKQLFPNVLTRKARSEFAKHNLIEFEDILELTKLTDVARMKWVGPKFARLLLESDYLFRATELCIFTFIGILSF